MKRFLFLLVFVSAASVAHAQGVVQLSTYYPSPFGKYDRIQLVPRANLDAQIPCDPGTMYINADAGNQLEVCNAAGNAWAPLSAGPWTQLGSDIYATDTTADVGIGTTTPTSRLHVVATQGYTPPGVFLEGTDINVDGGLDGEFMIRNNSASGTQKIFLTGTSGATPVLTVDGVAGRVGIGTISPQVSLHVERNQNSDTDLLIRNTTAGSDSLARFRASGSNGTGLLTYYDASYTFGGRTHFADRAEVRADSETTGLSLTASAPTGDIRFYAGGETTSSERMRITDTGNVGIGTATPGEELHLGQTAGDINLRLESPLPQKWDVGLSVGNFYPAGSFGIRNVTANNVPFVINTTGRVGIGATTPQAKFHIDVNNDTNGVNNLGDDLIVGAEGSVGIGTTPLPTGGGGAALYIKEGSSERLAKIVLQRSSTAKYLGIDFRRETGATEWSLMPSIEGGGSPGNFEIWEGGGSFRRFVIKNTTGNVGIGTADPGTNKLEVAGGPIKATGGLIIETRTTNPGAPGPVAGQMWLCTDPAPYCDGS